MRRRLAVLFVLLLSFALLPSSTWANQAVVQSTGGACSIASASCSITVTALGAGHLLYCGVNYGGTSQVTLTNCTGGGTYSVDAGCRAFDATNDIGLECAYVLSSTAGATTITANLSAAPTSFYEIEVAEISFTGTSMAKDNSGNADDTTTCSPCSGVTLTLSGVNDIIIQSIVALNRATSITGGYTLLTGTHFDGGYAFLNNTITGTAPNWTLFMGGTGPAVVNAIAFKEAGDGVITNPSGSSGKVKKLDKLDAND